MGKGKIDDPWHIQSYPIQATAHGEVYGESGLGIHCEVDVWITGLSGGRMWNVTHLASGYGIGVFYSQLRARVFVQEILSYTDWTRPCEQISADTVLLERVKTATAFATNWKPEEQKKLTLLREQVKLWKES